MKTFLLIVVLLIVTACAHFSSPERASRDVIIAAPIDIVWQSALQSLSEESVTIKTADPADYAISGWRRVGDVLSVRLTALGARHTQMHLEITTTYFRKTTQWKYQENMLATLLEKIKRLSERRLPPEDNDQRPETGPV
jgi:hypothetical protein